MVGGGPGRPAKARGPPHRQGKLCHCIKYGSNRLQFMGLGSGRPVRSRGPPYGLGRAARTMSTSHEPRLRPMVDGQRPGPFYQVFT